MSYPKIYESKYTDQLVSAPQIIAEKICEKRANKEKKVLVDKFWNTDKWKKIFIREVMLANRLLKIYSPNVILKALNSKELWWLTTLLGPQLMEACDKYNIHTEEVVLEGARTDVLPTQQKKKTSLDIIFDYDEGKKK